VLTKLVRVAVVQKQPHILTFTYTFSLKVHINIRPHYKIPFAQLCLNIMTFVSRQLESQFHRNPPAFCCVIEVRSTLTTYRSTFTHEHTIVFAGIGKQQQSFRPKLLKVRHFNS